jgi:hypothetical protein
MKRIKRLLLNLRGPLLPLPRRRADANLTHCRRCGSTLVNPLDWHEEDGDTWWFLLRCGECLHEREVVITDVEAAKFDRDLQPGLDAIERIIDQLDHERMRWEAEIFTTALERDLITASDFAAHGRR